MPDGPEEGGFRLLLGNQDAALGSVVMLPPMGHDNDRPDAVLAAAAAKQHGLITTADIAMAGLSSRSVRRREERGLFVHEGRGVWRFSAWPQSDEQRWLAACLMHGDGAVLSFRSAAHLLDMPVVPPVSVVHLLCPEPAKSRHPNVVTHRSRLLVPADAIVVRGVPTTSWARTWTDLSVCADLSDGQLLWIYDEGIRRGMATAESFHHTASRLRRGRGRSMRRIWRLLGQRPYDHDPGASQPESNVALWLRAAGFGRPSMNVIVVADGVRWELDISYVSLRVAIDYQSTEFHGGANIETQKKDERKRAVLEALGWAFFQIGPQHDERAVIALVGPELIRRMAQKKAGSAFFWATR